ncbi:MAG: tRNA(Ile)-lysidine synthetase, partial [Halocynthiibacter sp.]
DLGPLGITARTLAAVSLNLRAARRALDSSTQSILRNFARVEQGNVVFDLGEIMRQPPEITRRLLSHVLKWVSSADFAPRRQALENLAQSLREGRKTVLHGCMISVERDEIRVIREYQAVRGLCAEPGEIWDQRWILYGPVYKGLEVRALGEGGLLNCPKWRESGQPRDAIMASPGVWSGAELVAAPHASLSNSWRAELCKGEDDFFTSVLSH